MASSPFRETGRLKDNSGSVPQREIRIPIFSNEEELSMGKKNIRKAQGLVLTLVLLAMACLLVLSACASKPKQVKVGILNGHDFFAPVGEGFKAKMAELGYVEGDTIVYDRVSSGYQVDMDLYKKLAQQLVDDKVDLIVAYPTEASVIAKQVAAGKIPLVFTCASTEDTGLIDSIQSPGTNITGVRFPTPEIALRRLEPLRHIKPNLKHVLVPFLKGYPTVPSQTKALQPVIKDAGIDLIELPVSSPDELIAYLTAQEKKAALGIDAILNYSDPVSSTPAFMEPMFRFAAKHKIPMSSVEAAFGDAEFTVGVMIDSGEAGKQAAVLADKVLKGAAAGSIPVVTSENQLTLNYKTAQKLGLTVPEGLLKQAVKVVR
jgi:putative tryptophan/tyrosine transport system substrate-binding protein